MTKQIVYVAYLEGEDGEHEISLHTTEAGAETALRAMVKSRYEGDFEEEDDEDSEPFDIDTASASEINEWVGDHDARSAYIEEYEVQP